MNRSPGSSPPTISKSTIALAEKPMKLREPTEKLTPSFLILSTSSLLSMKALDRRPGYRVQAKYKISTE